MGSGPCALQGPNMLGQTFLVWFLLDLTTLKSKFDHTLQNLGLFTARPRDFLWGCV